MEESKSKVGNLHWADVLVVVLYFLFVIGIGLWASFRSSRNTLTGYFLASRNLHWIPVGASLFASNIGSGHFIGLAGSGAASGIAVNGYENFAVFILIIFGWIFTPVYMAAGVFTTPEYTCKRFGGQRIRVYLSCLALALSIFTKISVDLFAGAIFINLALGWDLYAAIFLLVVIAAVFTVLGGLTAVVWTDFIQTALMVIGAFFLMFLSFEKLEGINNLVVEYMAADPNVTLYDENGVSCGKSPDDSMHMLRSASPGASDLPWTGMLFGNFVIGIWYWSTDQVIVQRILSSKSMIDAKAATILASYIKLLPLFLMIFPGMAAKALYPNEVGCVVPEQCFKFCGSSSGCTNSAYPKLVIELMPDGLRGLMIAVMMAALMSSLTSIFNSSATIFTIDIWSRIRKRSNEYEKLIVGRLFVLVMVAVSILWVPVINASKDSQLFRYIQSIQSYLSPPIASLFTLALFNERITEPGAFWSLIIGLFFGLLRFGLEFGYTPASCGSGVPDTRPYFIKLMIDKVHFLHFGCLLYVVCMIIAMGISVMTKPIDKKHLHRLTWYSRESQQVRDDLDEETQTKEEHDAEAAVQSTSTPPSDAELPMWKRIANFLCGFDISNKNSVKVKDTMELSEEETAKAAALFLKEKPNEKVFVNIMAVGVLSLSAFIWGFFA